MLNTVDYSGPEGGMREAEGVSLPAQPDRLPTAAPA
jgi:hypothetical protein